MKWRLLLAGLIAAIIFFVLAVSVTVAAQPAPELVMAELFAKHPDFPCVAAYKANASAKFAGARDPFMDIFAASRGLDPDKVQCYWWTWLFDRDVNATNPFKEPGSGVAKGHYAVRGINNFDRAALHWRDLNEVAYELGGQPLFRYINDATDRPRHQWVIGNGMIAE